MTRFFQPLAFWAAFRTLAKTAQQIEQVLTSQREVNHV